MKIGMRLALGFGLVLILLAAGFAVGIIELSAINARTEQITRKEWVKSQLLYESQRIAIDNAMGTLQLIELPDARAKEEILSRIASQRAEFLKNLDKLDQLVYTEKGKRLMIEIRALEIHTSLRSTRLGR